MKILFLFIFISQIFLSQQSIFVSNKGNDKNNGTKQLPVYSLQAAFDLTLNKKSQPINIFVDSGDYYLDKPLILNLNYSRTKQTRIKVVGSKNNQPVFYGGDKLIPNIEKKSGYWVIQQKNNERNVLNNFQQLLSVNGKTRLISRYPSTDFVKPVNVVYNNDGFTITIPTELNDLLKSYSKDEVKKVPVTFYLKWTELIKYIDDYNYSESTISFKNINLPEIYKVDNHTRFKVSNIKTSIKPGAWYYKDNETILYKPFQNENPNKSSIVISNLEEFINIKGDNIKKIEYIDFENISLNTMGSGMDKNGYFPHQAAMKVNPLIKLSYARNINFSKMSLKNISSNVFWLSEGSSEIGIVNSIFSNIGAGAIKIGNENYDSNKDVTNYILVKNNLITKGGLIYPDGVPILILASHSNTIAHNEISDFSYTGISLGWVWGYGDSLTKNNLVAYNHIYNLGKDELDDMGGVYTLGRSEGTVIRNNVIHDIRSFTYGGWGIYTDEGSTGISIRNNLVYNCRSSGFHQHYGKDNVIENNIFAFNGNAELEATKIENHNSFDFKNNIVVHINNNFFSANWASVRKRSSNNIYYSLDGNNQMKLSELFSLQINPGLKKKKFYYEITNKANVKKINFVPIDFSKTGICDNISLDK